MTDETPKTPKIKAPKPEKKRASKGYRKYLRRQKAAAKKHNAGNG